MLSVEIQQIPFLTPTMAINICRFSLSIFCLSYFSQAWVLESGQRISPRSRPLVSPTETSLPSLFDLPRLEFWATSRGMQPTQLKKAS